MVQVSDVVNIVAGDNTITFPNETVFADTNYVLIAKAYKSQNFGIGLDVVKSQGGFVATVDDGPAVLEYFASGIGAQTIPQTTIPLSRDWTYAKLWREIERDLTLTGMLKFEKFTIINRAILTVVSRFYALMQRAYLTPQTIAVGETDVIFLDSLRIMRTGEPIAFHIESTGTRTIYPVSEQEFSAFDVTDFHNKSRIVWNYMGEKIRFARGAGLSTCGNCTLYLPRVPYYGAADDTKVDVADGATIPLVMLVGKRIAIERYGKGLAPVEPERFEEAVRALYQSFNFKVKTETIADDVKVLA